MATASHAHHHAHTHGSHHGRHHHDQAATGERRCPACGCPNEATALICRFCTVTLPLAEGESRSLWYRLGGRQLRAGRERWAERLKSWWVWRVMLALAVVLVAFQIATRGGSLADLLIRILMLVALFAVIYDRNVRRPRLTGQRPSDPEIVRYRQRHLRWYTSRLKAGLLLGAGLYLIFVLIAHFG